MERLTYPYVSEVSSCFGKPLSVLQGLKPTGLNETVYAKVLDSLSKKRSRLGDSEETYSEDANVSKEASLESSAVRGDGGPKSKKAKKAKKGKGDGSGASKPLVDVLQKPLRFLLMVVSLSGYLNNFYVYQPLRRLG
ncbi:hypothetical protein Hanom_Chr15g01376871 [Helianthus anomalus]